MEFARGLYCHSYPMRGNLLVEMPAFRMFLATDLGVSAVAIIIATSGVTVIIK